MKKEKHCGILKERLFRVNFRVLYIPIMILERFSLVLNVSFRCECFNVQFPISNPNIANQLYKEIYQFSS